jgi:hypothetical protein
MEDIRNYRNDENESNNRDDERIELSASPGDDEVPFHIPRD